MITGGSATQPEGFDVLDHVAGATLAGRIYQRLVGERGISVGRLADEVGATETVVRTQLAELEGLGMVLRPTGHDDIGWRAVQPAVAAHAQIAQRDAETSAIRERIQQLTELYWANYESAPPLVEIAATRHSLEEQTRGLINSATRRVRALAPRWHSWTESIGPASGGSRAPAGDVVFQIVNERSDAAHEATGDLTHTHVREVDELPMRLVIADDVRALVVLDGPDHKPIALLVQSPPLLTLLSRTFDTIWRDAEPLPRSAAFDDRHMAVLRLLAKGFSDDAISRRLQMSKRTLSRAIAEINDRLQATTRFQAGLRSASVDGL